MQRTEKSNKKKREGIKVKRGEKIVKNFKKW
jgi:hypothetical protein